MYKQEDVEALIKAAKDVGRMASSLMDELGNRKAVDWGLVNDTLVNINKALIRLGHKGNE